MLNSVKDLRSNPAVGSKVIFDYERPKDKDGNTDHAAFDEMRKGFPIAIHTEVDMISFKVMTKPASEGGKGCQFTDLIEVALHQLKYLNAKFPCNENFMTIHYLERALKFQERRTEDRVARNVEGKDEH